MNHRTLAKVPSEAWRLRPRLVLAVALLLPLTPGAVGGQVPFSATASPNPVTVQTGGAAVGVTVATAVTGDFREPIVYSFAGFPGGIATGGARTAAPPYAPVTFPFTAAVGVAPGTYTGTLTGTTSAGAITVPMTVIVQRPDFTLTASPGVLTLAPGASATVTLSAAGSGGFAGSVDVVSSGPPSVSVQPAALSLSPGSERAVVVTAASAAAPGAAAITFSGTAAGVDGIRTTAVTVTIRLPPPELDGITPSAVTAGTRETVLHLIGRHFQPGAVITSAEPSVRVLRSRVLGPTAAEVVVAVRDDAPPGPVRLDLRNPDGAAAAGGASVVVHPPGSLGGPLSVTGIHIVSPRPWEVVAEDEAVHARALLATSGMGTVVVTWLLDGVPFDRFTRVVSGGQPVEVRSRLPIPRSFIGEHRLELVVENPRTLPPQAVVFIQAASRASGLRVLTPAADGRLDPAAAVFRWSPVPGASGYEVEVRYRPSDAPGSVPWTAVRRRVTDTRWRPEAGLVEALAGHDAAFRLRPAFPGDVLGDPTSWRPFVFAREGTPGPGADDGAPAPEPDGYEELGSWGPDPPGGHGPATAPASDTASPARPSRDLGAAIGSTTTARSSDLAGPPALTRLQISVNTDLRDRFEQQVAGDLSARHDLGDPWNSRVEGRSWTARLDQPDGDIRPNAVVGFSPPSFFDGSEFLSVFTSGGGVQGGLAATGGRVSYYHSARLSGDRSGMGAEPEFGAAAYELFSPDGRFLFRATTLRVTERPVEDFSPGGSGSAVGFLASAELGAGLSLQAEAAFGEYTPEEDGPEEARDGRAFRLSAQGVAGTFHYTVRLGRTGAGFVNPANPGFTPGGISARTRAEIGVGNTFGRASVSGSVSHTRGGIAEAFGDPRTMENGGNLAIAVPVSARVAVTLGGSLAGQSGVGVEELELPGTDRASRAVDLSVTESFGALNLSQTLSWQGVRDRLDPWADQDVLNLNLAAHGSVHRLVDVSASAAASRIAAAPEIGTTTQRMLSLQPALRLADTGLRLGPRLAFSRSRSDQYGDTRSTHYQLVARWTAPWSRVPLAIELASDWNRSWSDFDETRPPFQRRTLLTLNLDWRTQRAW